MEVDSKWASLSQNGAQGRPISLGEYGNAGHLRIARHLELFPMCRWAARGRYRSVFGEVWNSLRYFGGLLPPDFLRLVGTWRIRGVVRQISLSAPVFCQSENLHFGRYLGVVIVTSVAIAAPFFCQSIFVAFINRFSRDSVWFS